MHLRIHSYSAKSVPIRVNPGGSAALNCRSGRVGMPIGNSLPIFADQYQSARIRVGRQFLPGKTANQLGSTRIELPIRAERHADPLGPKCRNPSGSTRIGTSFVENLQNLFFIYDFTFFVLWSITRLRLIH